MKILVSYLSSRYDRKKTIDLINVTNADAIHADLMDGLYVPNKNFLKEELSVLYKDNKKPLEFHLMLLNPQSYFDTLYKFNPTCIYIHPSTTDDVEKVLRDISSHGIEAGIVINPDEDIAAFLKLFSLASRVILMSVVPGKGGQPFLEDTIARLNILKKYQKEYGFKIIIDGGINVETITKVTHADGVVSGSYICHSDDFQRQIDNLRNSF